MVGSRVGLGAGEVTLPPPGLGKGQVWRVGLARLAWQRWKGSVLVLEINNLDLFGGESLDVTSRRVISWDMTDNEKFLTEVIRQVFDFSLGWKTLGHSALRRCSDGTYALSYGDNSQVRGSLEVCLEKLKEVEGGIL